MCLHNSEPVGSGSAFLLEKYFSIKLKYLLYSFRIIIFSAFNSENEGGLMLNTENISKKITARYYRVPPSFLLFKKQSCHSGNCNVIIRNLFHIDIVNLSKVNSHIRRFTIFPLSILAKVFSN